jgi:hypothetical protein
MEGFTFANYFPIHLPQFPFEICEMGIIILTSEMRIREGKESLHVFLTLDLILFSLLGSITLNLKNLAPALQFFLVIFEVAARVGTKKLIR